MTTFGDLKYEVLSQIQGFVNDQEVLSTLSGSVTNSATTFTVVSGEGFGTGVMEIGEELVYVQSFNQGTGVATNVIRGYRGTTAMAHDAGDLVRVAPQFPLSAVGRAINDTIASLHPKVPAIKTYDFTCTTTQVRYQLPAEVSYVIDVSLQDLNDTYAWAPLTTWRFIPMPGDTLDAYTALDVVNPFASRTCRVVYATAPSALTNSVDEFTDTGLQDFAKETVVLGAMWRLYSTADLGRSSVNTASQQLLNRSDPTGNSTNFAKYLLGMYQQSLDELSARIQKQYPIRKHYVW